MPDAAALPVLRDGSVLTVGAFDGIHLGHGEIVRQVVACAAKRSLPSALVTFRPHPLAVVNPSAAPLLLTPDEEQREALAESGLGFVIVLPFTPGLAAYSAEAFVREVLVARYRVRELVVGFDHGLGRGRSGDADALRSLGSAMGFSVHVVPAAVGADGAPISASSIRRAVAYGELDRARSLLGRPYSFRGTVVPGSRRGRELGFPTLNLVLPSERKLLPPEGVYAVRVQAQPGTFGGMMNLGSRPTFGDAGIALEVHLFDGGGDWYDRSARVEFVGRLRDTTRFASRQALAEQLARDAEDARIALTQA